MIGTTKLSEIRKKLVEAMGPNPIAELDQQIAAAKLKGEGTDVIEGLKRFIQRSRKKNPRRRAAVTN